MRQAQEQLTQQKEVILAQEREIKGKSEEANRLREHNNDAQLKIKELEHNINKHKKDSADAASRVSVQALPTALGSLAHTHTRSHSRLSLSLPPRPDSLPYYIRAEIIPSDAAGHVIHSINGERWRIIGSYFAHR